jgi:GntR family transcriptional regulator, transcriptional repressor for pyruvate dehydrogenase complex
MSEHGVGAELIEDGGSDWIQPIRTPRAFEEILDQLEQALLSGRLTAGGRLPPERDFASALGVSRASVREALRVLEALGLVEVNRGPGGAVLRREPGNAFADILRLHLALGHYSWDSIIELRVILERWAFARAAARVDNLLLEELSRLIDKMDDSGIDPRTFLEFDVAFHSQIVAASEDALLAGILDGCRALIRKGMLEVITAGTWPVTAARLVEEHRQLYDLIAQGDPDAAAEGVEEHIRRWDPRSAELATSGSDDGSF